VIYKIRSVFGEPKIDIDFIRIPAGRFIMGCQEKFEGRCFDGDRPAHEVEVSSFEISKYEVTVGQFRSIVPDHQKSYPDNIPVGLVNWYEAQGFAAWLDGRLPTEAEWEYAARGNTITAFSKGNSVDDATKIGWFDFNSGVYVQPVGLKEPNSFGIHDMHGNVREWCSDWFAPYSSKFQKNPKGPYRGTDRITRGGSFMLGWQWARSAARFQFHPNTRYVHFGFRIIRSVSKQR
jgi:formylglycine-generating enzyme required for sulfatase activity